MIENKKKAMASFEVSLYRKIYIIRHRGNTDPDTVGYILWLTQEADVF